MGPGTPSRDNQRSATETRPPDARGSKIAHELLLVWTASGLIWAKLHAKPRQKVVFGQSWDGSPGRWGVRMLVFGSIVLLMCVAASLRVIALAFDE